MGRNYERMIDESSRESASVFSSLPQEESGEFRIVIALHRFLVVDVCAMIGWFTTGYEASWSNGSCFQICLVKPFLTPSEVHLVRRN